MLRVALSDRFDVIGCGVWLHPQRIYIQNTWYPYIGVWSDNFQPGYLAQDTLFDEINFDLNLGYYDAYQAIRIFNPDSPIISIGDRKPRAVRAYSASEDGGRYGGLGGATHALSPSTATNLRRYWSRETDLVDRSARGALQLSEGSGDAYHGSQNYAYLGFNFRVHNDGQLTDRIYHYDSGQGFNILEPQLGVVWPENPRRITDIDEFIASNQSNDSGSWDPSDPNFELYWGPRRVRAWSDFKIARVGNTKDGSVKITYIFECWVMSQGWLPLIQGNAWCRDKYLVTIDVNYQNIGYKTSRWHLPIANGTFYLDMEGDISASRTYELLEESSALGIYQDLQLPADYPWPRVQTDLGGLVHVSPLIILKSGGPSRQKTQDIVGNNRLLRNNGVDALNEFRSFVGDIHPRIRGGAALSANDCLENYSSSSNFLESFPELPQVFRSIKDIGRIGKLIKEISSGNPKAVPHFIDLLADAYLAYKYGAKPLASDISESKRIATDFYNQVDVLSKDLPRHLYGNFKFQIPGHLSIPGDLSVLIKTKMVLRSSPGGLLAYVIALDSVGLLPSLARVWDLVPFSFVIDWFTSLSSRLEDIDDMVIRTALDLDYYVHTYTYTFLADPEAYKPFRRSQGQEPPQLRMFIRERSLFHPSLLKAKDLDFHPPQGLKKQSVSAGALLWST